jgi:hypothetical protein
MYNKSYTIARKNPEEKILSVYQRTNLLPLMFTRPLLKPHFLAVLPQRGILNTFSINILLFKFNPRFDAYSDGTWTPIPITLGQ